MRISAPWAQLPVIQWAAASQDGGAADTQGSRGRAMGMLPFPPAADLLHTCELGSCPSNWHLPFFRGQWATAVAQHKAWWVILVLQYLPCTLLCIKRFVLCFLSWQCCLAPWLSTCVLNVQILFWCLRMWLLLHHPHPVEPCFETCCWTFVILSHLLKIRCLQVTVKSTTYHCYILFFFAQILPQRQSQELSWTNSHIILCQGDSVPFSPSCYPCSQNRRSFS